MRCPNGSHEIPQVYSWMYRCDEHGVTVVCHNTSTSPEAQLQLERVERQLDELDTGEPP